MIRDPSDGSVREPQKSAPPTSAPHNSGERLPSSDAANGGADTAGPLFNTGTSGLPITKAKADYLARLEESRKWLKEYVCPTIS